MDVEQYEDYLIEKYFPIMSPEEIVEKFMPNRAPSTVVYKWRIMQANKSRFGQAFKTLVKNQVKLNDGIVIDGHCEVLYKEFCQYVGRAREAVLHTGKKPNIPDMLRTFRALYGRFTHEDELEV